MATGKILDFRKNKVLNGYKISIDRGIKAVTRFRSGISYGSGTLEVDIDRLVYAINKSEAIIIGAGAGMSTAAGFIYNGPRFEKYFFDFQNSYGINEMYSGGFYPYPTKEIFWAYWARYIYVNRYMDPPKKTYEKLFDLVKDKDYFVITTNVDHCFQKAGFDKKRLFYTQGDYGLFQSVNPKIRQTFDNAEWVMNAMEAQGFIKNSDGIFEVPEDKKIKMEIPTELIPKCPEDGSDMTTNLRADDSFVEDEGWHEASAEYGRYLETHKGQKILYLELGVGSNTPVIIKYPFWQMTADNENAAYACVNYGESYCPKGIEERSICIDGDIDSVLDRLSECESYNMDQDEKRLWLIKYLLGENIHYKNTQIPDDVSEQKDMLRALMNVRMPIPVTEEFLKVQDDYLKKENSSVGYISVDDMTSCKRDDRIYIWQGDITRLSVDAIVNAANSQMLGCFQPLHACIDKAAPTSITQVYNKRMARCS